MLDLPHLSANAKYLGIPLFFHRSKKRSLADLKEKMLSKIVGWKSKLLSQAARTTLIKSVANAIPSYTMSLFLLPKGFCKEINSLLRKFWWGFPQDKKHNLSFLAWDNICKPKTLGGLGIRNMETMNLSLLAKLGWKIITEPSLLWVAGFVWEISSQWNLLP
jgi:hypothetical protein